MPLGMLIFYRVERSSIFLTTLKIGLAIQSPKIYIFLEGVQKKLNFITVMKH